MQFIISMSSTAMLISNTKQKEIITLLGIPCQTASRQSQTSCILHAFLVYLEALDEFMPCNIHIRLKVLKINIYALNKMLMPLVDN